MRLLIALAFIPTLAFANPIDDKCPQHTIFGAPISKIESNDQYICKTNYAIHYRYDTKTAEYVVEHLDSSDITGPATREDDFRPDKDIPVEHQAQLSDYAGMPYDRGHLVPAADNKASEEVMSESFFLSNMVPQTPNNNRGIWRILELKTRDLGLIKDVYVISGTIYDVGYLTIGDGKVGVPSRLWKVVYDNTDRTAIAFIFPNAALPVADMPKYAVTVSDVEQATGINFFPKEKDAVFEQTKDFDAFFPK